MNELTDERLMAYVDGELPPAEASRIQAALENNPAARQRVDIFKESAALLSETYDAPINEAVPQQLIDTVMAGSSPARPAGIINKIRIAFTAGFPGGRWVPAYGLAILAALVVGIGTGFFAFRWTSPSGGMVFFPGSAFSQGLETTPSGRTFTLADPSVLITPVATFQDQAHRYCRQYEMNHRRNNQTLIFDGIACRTQGGRWQPVVQIQADTPGSRPVETATGYVPAGRTDLFDDVIGKIMATPPLSPDRESALIQSDWH